MKTRDFVNLTKSDVAKFFSDLVDDLTDFKTLTDELHTDHATFVTLCGDLKTLLNNLRTHLLNHPLGNPGLAIVSNFDVQNANAISYVLAGKLYTLSANQTCDTGSQAIAADKWGIMLVSVNASGSLTGTWSVDHADEATAIANLPAVPANEVAIGYVTVKTAAGQSWTAGTDALKGGTGGNPASETNYYNMYDVENITAAVSSSPPATLSASQVTLKMEK
jgi:hypothetical protein